MRWCALITLLILGSGCSTAPVVIQPQPPERVAPPECRVDADKPQPRTTAPDWMKAECTDNACRERKARAAADLVVQADTAAEVEHARRQACVQFIDGKVE